ncbi:eCIS core domain-containing protein [Mucilaginibacter sp. NFX135]|uniref:eCIS core domain-containing protein n=1 Tax=Mucilaginibacter sp. NFX135 TaxID=3402687 RepID=UPI003AFAC002
MSKENESKVQYPVEINSFKKRDDKSSFFQPKLSVNQPNDVYEQEADAMANQVMRMVDPAQNETSFFKPAENIQRKCGHCDEEQNVHRKERSGSEAQGGNDLNNYIGSLGSSGQALPDSSRSFFEPRFGHYFSNVRIHTDSIAAKSADSINALAYTTGNNIVFNSGQYSPESDNGKKLMAHELTHVLQQTQNGQQIQRKPLTKPQLIAKIKTYGITAVLDDTSTFSDVELDLVDQALAGLPVGDKAAIKGAKILRVNTLGGTTAGMYSNSQGFNDTSVTDEQKIELSDLAFGTNTADESIRLITHEVGHAVAAMPHRVAMSSLDTEGLKFNKLNTKANDAVTVFNTANDATNAAIVELNEAVDKFNSIKDSPDKAAVKAAKDDFTAKKTKVDRLKAVSDAKEADFNTKKSAAEVQKTVVETKQAAADAKLANVDDLKKDAAAKLTVMETAFNAAGPVISKDDTDSAAYRTSLTNCENAIKKFYDDNAVLDVETKIADSAKAVADAAIKDRNTKRDDLNKANPKNTVVSVTAALEAAQNSFYNAALVMAFNKSMGLSVKAFYDLVVKNNISPALTPYAAKNWPAKPEEFYAEAYSFFVKKPTDLETHSKVLFDWFKAGSYK